MPKARVASMQTPQRVGSSGLGKIRREANVLGRNEEVDGAVVIPLQNISAKLSDSRLVDAAINLAHIPMDAVNRIGPAGRSGAERGLDQSETRTTLAIGVVKLEIAVADDHLIL